MSTADYGALTRDGLWKNNPALVQVLGLCPLLAITNTTINGLALGLATLLVLLTSNGLISLIRNQTRPEIRIPVFVLVIACSVTSIELAMNAWFHDLYGVLGIFIALITTNCVIIARAEAFASRNPVLPSLYDGFLGAGDKPLLALARTTAPEQLAALEGRFRDPRLPELLFRYRARNHPDSLAPDERQRWQDYRRQRLLGDGGLGELNLPQYQQQLDALAAEAPDDARRQDLLQSLRDWGQHLQETL